MTQTDPPETESGNDPNESNARERRTLVRERYSDIAATDADDGDDCCAPSCCAEDDDRDETDALEAGDADARSLELGYDRTDLEEAPDGANLGLGCGNPVAISNLDPGETVVDLGSGGGFDCFLAAEEVGPQGRVIGVDMTPEMLERARSNREVGAHDHVEFRLGEIEHLPVADATADVVISNCVLNLSPAKPRVLAEAFRVLRPGGRLSISDLVTTGPLPAAVREDPDLVAGCVGGAASVEDLEGWLEAAGFEAVSITPEGEWDADYEGEALPIVSARIEARKPQTGE